MSPLSNRYQEFLDALADGLDFPLVKFGHTVFTPGKALSLVGFALAAYFVCALIEHGLRGLTRPGRKVVFSEAALYALSRMLRYVVWITAFFFGLDYVGLNVEHLALLGGAVGVGIGLGLQNIFSNFVSGIVLLLEQTLKVGDFVDLQSGVVGRVSEINVRYTRVTTNDSADVIVPNSEFVSARVINWTFSERSRRVHVPFCVAYGSDKDAVRQAGLAAAARVSGTIDDEQHAPDVWLVGFGESALEFELVVWVDQRLALSPGWTRALYLWELETEFRTRKIIIPYPQRVVTLVSTPGVPDLQGTPG